MPPLGPYAPIAQMRRNQLMTELLDLVLQAHGGIERWRTFDTVRATFVSSGGLLPLKGLEVTPKSSEAIATIREESLRIDGYRQPDWRMRFTPDRVVIESMNAQIVKERTNPRESFAGHTLTTAWDTIQVAYFNGYARWTYLTTPFFMAMPGFYVTEIEPWKEGSEIWRGLRVRFPPMTIGWKSAVGFRSRNTCTTSSRPTDFDFRPNAELFRGALDRNPSGTCS
jgi:hypothetical protein